MDLTNEIVEKHGFERINNSMWRMCHVTLQNGYTHEGADIYEKILNTKKAYRFCYKGKFMRMISTEKQLIAVLTQYKGAGENNDTGEGKCDIQRVINCPFCNSDRTTPWGVNHDWYCIDCDKDFEGCL